MSEDASRPPLPAMSAAEAAASPPPRRRKMWPWIVAASAVVVVAGVAVAIPVSIGAAQRAADDEAAAAEKARLDTFRANLFACGVGYQMNVDFLDGGESVELDRVTKSDGITYDQLTCFLKSLNAPGAIEAEIGQTRALDGRQTDTWDGYAISWAYHPDSGASIIVKHAD